MPDINEAIENLARAFYELDGAKWEDATKFVQQAVRTHVRSGLLSDPELLAEIGTLQKQPVSPNRRS